MNTSSESIQTPAHGATDSFLGCVARAYAETKEDLSQYCFIFPNKRACTFFLNNLTEQIGRRTMLAPETMTVGEFVTDLSGRLPAERIDLVFRLFHIYCTQFVSEVKWEAAEGKEEMLDFDRFSPWAEVMLEDFNEVEQYCVDAEKLFVNVRDYQNISSNYLTEEQLEVMERFFGYRPTSEGVEGFWKTVQNPDEDPKSKTRSRFVYLWSLLPTLFSRLLEELERDGLCLPGSAYRIALEKVRDENWDPGSRKRVVAVGFNAPSTAESLIFAALSDRICPDGRPFMEFFWDAAGPVLSDPKSGPGEELARNMRNFSMPEWAAPYMAPAARDTLPATVIVEASPSNAAQAKLAGMRVDELLAGGADTESESRTAVVLPDENLLLPLLYSLPDKLSGVNLTMGYSMRFTAVASFVHHLRMLLTRMRKSGGETGFFHEEFKRFLGHPLVHLLVGTEVVSRLNEAIDRERVYVVTPGFIRENGAGELSGILRPLDAAVPAADVIEYLDSVMERLDVALALNKDAAQIKCGMERSQIFLYRTALSRLLDCVRKYRVEMGFRSVFRLVDHLLSGEKITFQGDPLAGLQVLGLLETRCIDFDHVIILSANDNILPSRGRKRTFVPDALRIGYGLPLQAKAENLYSYYFWRLLSRAKDVTLIYDARAGEGMRSGGKSRFLFQLDMLYSGLLPAGCRVEHRDYSFRLAEEEMTLRPVAKDEKVMERLRGFTVPGSGMRLSASALRKYAVCPVRFYYEVVMRIGDDPERGDGMDDLTVGLVVHDVMQHIYLRDPATHGKYLKKRPVVTAQYIDACLNDPVLIPTLVTRAVNAKYLKRGEDELDRPLSGGAAMSVEPMSRLVRNILMRDREQAPFEMVGVEMNVDTRWQVSPELAVNMVGYLDRVDCRDGKLRIVDYKTGRAHVKAAAWDDVFSGDNDPKGDARNILQLMLYGCLLDEYVTEREGVRPDDVGFVIYEAYNILNHSYGQGVVTPTVDSKASGSLREVEPEFRAGLNEMIGEIFDESKPFAPAADPASCAYCRLQSLCGRI